MTTRPVLEAWALLQLQLRTLDTIVRVFESHGIPSLPVKGALLAHQLRDDPIERPMADVDLLVRPRDFARAVRVGRAAGFALQWDSRTLGSVNFVAHGISVDTASSIGPPGTAAYGVERCLARAKRAVEPLGFPHYQIEWHDHALLLLVNAFKDKLPANRPVLRDDLFRMAAAPSFDPRTMVARVREARLETLAAIVIDWLLLAGPSEPWTRVRSELTNVRADFHRAFLASVAEGAGSLRTRILARAANDAPARRVLALALGAVGTGIFSIRHGVFPGANAGQGSRRA